MARDHVAVAAARQPQLQALIPSGSLSAGEVHHRHEHVHPAGLGPRERVLVLVGGRGGGIGVDGSADLHVRLDRHDGGVDITHVPRDLVGGPLAEVQVIGVALLIREPCQADRVVRGLARPRRADAVKVNAIHVVVLDHVEDLLSDVGLKRRHAGRHPHVIALAELHRIIGHVVVQPVAGVRIGRIAVGVEQVIGVARRELL